MSTLPPSILRTTLFGLLLAALPAVYLEAAEFLGVDIEVGAEGTVARVRTDQDVDYRVSPNGLAGVAVELRPVRVRRAWQLAGGGAVEEVRVEPIKSSEPATRVTFVLSSNAIPQFQILPGGVLELRFGGSAAAQAQVPHWVAGARLSVEHGPRYDASYSDLPYPGGDPGWAVGCGVDVVVRAYRHSGFDLQQLIHQDILLDATAYGIAEADTNIDHRRLRNLERFLKRRAERLPTRRAADWQPGDLVLWSRSGTALADHVGIISDRSAATGRPLVIHHTPGGPPREADDLFRWPIRAHLRWWPDG